TIISGDNRRIVSRRYGAGALDSNIGRNTRDNGWRIIVDRNGLGLAAAVTARIGGRVGSFDDKLIGTRAGSGLVGVGYRRRTSTVIGGHHGAVIRGRNGAGAFHGHIGGDARDGWSGGVINSDGLDLAAAVATGIGRSVGAFDHKLVGA